MNMRGRIRENIGILGLRGLVVAAMLAFMCAMAVVPATAQTDGAPPARDYVSCGHFETQADAQDVLDSGELDANGIASLDNDGDGAACEDAIGTGSNDAATAPTPVAVQSLPSTGSGATETGDSALVFLAGLAMVSLSAALVVHQQSRR